MNAVMGGWDMGFLNLFRALLAGRDRSNRPKTRKRQRLASEAAKQNIHDPDPNLELELLLGQPLVRFPQHTRSCFVPGDERHAEAHVTRGVFPVETPAPRARVRDLQDKPYDLTTWLKASAFSKASAAGLRWQAWVAVT